MAAKKAISKKTVENEKVSSTSDLIELKVEEALNKIADNIIDNMNTFFSLYKIHIDDFDYAEYKCLNHSESPQAKKLLAYVFSTIPYFNKLRIGLNTNSKGIINSVYLLDRESAINYVDEKHLI